ncbi:Hypothetical protein SMAX5B_013957 [Scophthalmus maximus]|uniref:Uncharacterized protein n=1 Tax=Scophthalmus maximus TaxID=52904 RepID=A0A2U9CG34_SCOMX|nr:Hypothetical protein SMAX5B_013957 [Scophthalmus maximus]
MGGGVSAVGEALIGATFKGAFVRDGKTVPLCRACNSLYYSAPRTVEFNEVGAFECAEGGEAVDPCTVGLDNIAAAGPLPMGTRCEATRRESCTSSRRDESCRRMKTS